jgi:hypothetical protein
MCCPNTMIFSNPGTDSTLSTMVRAISQVIEADVALFAASTPFLSLWGEARGNAEGRVIQSAN